MRLIAAGDGWIAYRNYSFDAGSDAILGSDDNKGWEISRHLKLNPGYRVAIDGNNPRRVESVRRALIDAGVPAALIHSGAYGVPRLMRDDRVTVLVGSGIAH